MWQESSINKQASDTLKILNRLKYAKSKNNQKTENMNKEYQLR